MHTCVKFEDFLLMPLAGHVKTLEKSEPNCRFQKSMMILLFQVNGPDDGGRPRTEIEFNSTQLLLLSLARAKAGGEGEPLYRP